MTGLREATRELHHAAERHPVGAAMAAGTISEAWWMRWLMALLDIHLRLDQSMPPVLRRIAELERDIAAMPGQLPVSAAAWAYAQTLTTEPALRAAGYVFTGAHLMGGAVTDRALAGRLPCAHLRWEDRRAALDAWRPWREAEGLEDEARRAFAVVLAIMDEIAG